MEDQKNLSSSQSFLKLLIISVIFLVWCSPLWFKSQFSMALILTGFSFSVYGISHLLHCLCTAIDVCLTSPQPGKCNKPMWNMSKTVRTSIRRAHSRVCYSRTIYSILNKGRRDFLHYLLNSPEQKSIKCLWTWFTPIEIHHETGDLPYSHHLCAEVVPESYCLRNYWQVQAFPKRTMEWLKQKSVLICHPQYVPHLYGTLEEGTQTQSEHEDCLPQKAPKEMQPKDSPTVQTLLHNSNYLLTFSRSSSFSSMVAFLLASAACWSLAFTIVSTHWWHFFNRSWNANLSYYHRNKQQLKSEACSTTWD